MNIEIQFSFGGNTVSINPIHNDSIDITALLNNKVNNTNISGVEKNTSISSFSQMLSEACNTNITVSDMFQAAFSGNNVQTKVGNCNVPWKCWDRNDFPIWEYFKKDTTVECLNNWRPTKPDSPQSDSAVQRGLSQIGYGEMVILMPPKLQEKMEADPKYAEEVLKKLQKWKENYDREDNAIAASLGYNPELSQLSKSYCIQLDEDGNVGDHTVIGGGLDDKKTDEEIVIISRDDDKPVIIKKNGQKMSKSWIEVLDMTGKIDFENTAPNLMDIKMKRRN